MGQISKILRLHKTQILLLFTTDFIILLLANIQKLVAINYRNRELFVLVINLSFAKRVILIYDAANLKLPIRYG
jgi:hypothetical protein